MSASTNDYTTRKKLIYSTHEEMESGMEELVRSLESVVFLSWKRGAFESGRGLLLSHICKLGWRQFFR
jgi:hypothetical protein